jgi:hypothetical protein
VTFSTYHKNVTGFKSLKQDRPANIKAYIGEEALRPLARMIARRLLTERKYRVGSNVQPGTLPVAFEKPLTDLTHDKEGNQ